MKFFGQDDLAPHPWKQPLGVVTGGVQQVRLTESGFSPDEKWVVSPGGCFGDGEGGGGGEPVGRAACEGVEGVAPVEADGLRVIARDLSWPAGEVGRPTL